MIFYLRKKGVNELYHYVSDWSTCNFFPDITKCLADRKCTKSMGVFLVVVWCLKRAMPKYFKSIKGFLKQYAPISWEDFKRWVFATLQIRLLYLDAVYFAPSTYCCCLFVTHFYENARSQKISFSEYFLTIQRNYGQQFV